MDLTVKNTLFTIHNCTLIDTIISVSNQVIFSQPDVLDLQVAGLQLDSYAQCYTLLKASWNVDVSFWSHSETPFYIM